MDPLLLEFLEIAEQADVKNARRAVYLYKEWLDSNELQLLKINTKHARAYRDFLIQQEYHPVYAKNLLQVIKAFYVWVHHTEAISPFRRINIQVKQARYKPRKLSKRRVLTQRQLDLIRAAIPRTHDTPYEFYRLYVLYAFILYAGLTLRELSKMTIEDTRGYSLYLHWKERSIPYSPQMKSLVTHYLAHRAAKTKDENHSLFPYGSGAYTAKRLSSMLAHLSAEARVNFSEQDLLDTFAYNLAVDGAPAALISSLRGCSVADAEEFISIAANSEEIARVYLRSVEQRMRPVRRRRPKRVD